MPGLAVCGSMGPFAATWGELWAPGQPKLTENRTEIDPKWVPNHEQLRSYPETCEIMKNMFLAEAVLSNIEVARSEKAPKIDSPWISGPVTRI